MRKLIVLLLLLSALGTINANATTRFDKVGAQCWVSGNYVYLRGTWNNYATGGHCTLSALKYSNGDITAYCAAQDELISNEVPQPNGSCCWDDSIVNRTRYAIVYGDCQSFQWYDQPFLTARLCG